jgi:NAD(P)H-dependent flavin oxidoreductase YrpB (nitropropane dioxygenase family)
MLGIEYPVILAGMGGVARAELVAAVSNAGGLGVIGAAVMPPDELRREIRKVRDLTDKPFGVDLLLPTMGQLPDVPQGVIQGRDIRQLFPKEQREFVEKLKRQWELPEAEEREPPVRFGPDFIRRQMEVVLEEGVPVFASGLGNPAPFVPELHRSGAKVIALVGNVKNALRVREGGADIIVAQGHEAGGHTGRIGTMALVPQVVDAVAPTPVVAAGGIGDGRGLAAALCLGAVGVWVGTAFLVSEEAHLDPDLKRRILEASEEDTRVTRIYSGKPMRNIVNPLIEEWERAGVPTLPFPFQGALIREITLPAEKAGRKELLMNPAGQISGMLRRIRPAREILEEMVAQAAEIIQRTLPSQVEARLD